jgi:acetyl/propionyl-CoA carboxylase alpha subunit
MGAKVSTVLSSWGASNRRGPPTYHAGPAAGRERRLDIHVFVSEAGGLATGRAWERCVWRDARVLIAECPAPHLPVSVESALRAVAADVARDRGWQGMGTVAFALDDRSGVFRVIDAQAQAHAGTAVHDCEPVAAHALELRIDGCVDRRLPCTRLLVCGATRGEVLRRAYRALSEMPGPAGVDRAFLMNRIASRAYCSGLTGTRLDQAVG